MDVSRLQSTCKFGYSFRASDEKNLLRDFKQRRAIEVIRLSDKVVGF